MWQEMLRKKNTKTHCKNVVYSSFFQQNIYANCAAIYLYKQPIPLKAFHWKFKKTTTSHSICSKSGMGCMWYFDHMCGFFKIFVFKNKTLWSFFINLYGFFKNLISHPCAKRKKPINHLIRPLHKKNEFFCWYVKSNKF
jgi:hypothetical protein